VFEYKPDFEQVMDRFEAWWECEITDRPPVSLRFRREESERIPWPKSTHATQRERWMDTEHVVACAEASAHNTVWYGDAIPSTMPNLGPEVFSAMYGCELEFGEQTSWSRPNLADWSEESLAALQIDESNQYYKKIFELTDALIEAGKGRFIVGYTDLHGGGDAIAAFRDPQNLLIDTIEHPREIKALCDRITDDFLAVYDKFHTRLSAAGMPSTTWLPATCRGKYHVPSNDFSCMISDETFEELFIPGIVRECQHMDRCIYHLDGPQALRYLDRLLEIAEIHAIQWVPGAGNDYWADWIEVYRRIQAAGKAFVIGPVPVNDLPRLFEALEPGGVWIDGVAGVTNIEEADAVLKQTEAWAAGK